MAKIILASSSPYRKALLERLGITFDCVSPDVDEDKYKEKINNPVELAQTLAKLKAQAVFEKNKDCIVIGSDQLLSFEGKTYGKPKTATRAFEHAAGGIVLYPARLILPVLPALPALNVHSPWVLWPAKLTLNLKSL